MGLKRRWTGEKAGGFQRSVLGINSDWVNPRVIWFFWKR